MTPRLIAAPVLEPVSLDELKAQLSLLDDAEDMRLETLLVVARSVVERMARRLLITQTWRVTLDAFPPGGALALPLAPVQTVSAVAVADAAGTMVPVPGSTYLLDLSCEPARLVLTGALPVPGLPVGGIRIDVVAGYGPTAEAVPAPLRQAVMLLAAHWWRARGTAAEDRMPADVEALVDGFRTRRLVA